MAAGIATTSSRAPLASVVLVVGGVVLLPCPNCWSRSAQGKFFWQRRLSIAGGAHRGGALTELPDRTAATGERVWCLFELPSSAKHDRLENTSMY